MGATSPSKTRERAMLSRIHMGRNTHEQRCDAWASERTYSAILALRTHLHQAILQATKTQLLPIIYKLKPYIIDPPKKTTIPIFNSLLKLNPKLQNLKGNSNTLREATL